MTPRPEPTGGTRSSSCSSAQKDAKALVRICFDRWPNLFLGKDLDGVRNELGMKAS